MTRSLYVPDNLLAVVAGSNQCYIYYSAELDNLLYQTFGRKGTCLKAFRHPAIPLDEFPWNPTRGVLLTECTKAQNLFALHGRSPRVYDIVLLNDTSWAQVTDYVRPDASPPSDDPDNAVVMKQYGIGTNWDMNKTNWVNGWLVDFGAFHWTYSERYEKELIDRAYKFAAWGSREEPYQSVLGTPSQRDMAHRTDVMRLQEIDFGGKTVLSLGCNLGAFCMDAYDRGAKRVIGVDLSDVATLAYECANWKGYWNLDFVGANLPGEANKIAEQTGIETFDIIYALSIDRQIGYAPWMAALCNDVFFLEGHVPDKEHTYRERLEADFSEVEVLGPTRDHGPRPLFRCKK